MDEARPPQAGEKTISPSDNGTPPRSGSVKPKLEPEKIRTKAGLWWPRAVLQSLRDASIDFYPRLNTPGRSLPNQIKTAALKLRNLRRFQKYRRLAAPIRERADRWKLPNPDKIVIASLKSDDILAQMAKAMGDWTGPIVAGDVMTAEAAKAVLEQIAALEEVSKEQFDKIRADAKAALDKSTAPEMSLDDAIDLAKASLVEVKAQTEYQDQKATRLLTVTTFLSALSGALFASFSSNYPLRMADSLSAGWRFALFGAYLTFLCFVLAALGGALVTFHATRTRFKYSKEATAKRQAGPTRSFLFFREMIGVSPKGWADSFVVVKDGKALLRPQLKEEYFKNYVTESYLIAAKTADKLRYLGPAQSLLAWALRCLLLFVILIAAIQTYVAKQPVAPTEFKLIAPAKPVSVNVDLSPRPAPNQGPVQGRSGGQTTPADVQVRVRGN